MDYILVFFWFINGVPTIIDGWSPILVEDQETCEARREFAYDYLQNNYTGETPYQIECIERTETYD